MRRRRRRSRRDVARHAGASRRQVARLGGRDPTGADAIPAAGDGARVRGRAARGAGELDAAADAPLPALRRRSATCRARNGSRPGGSGSSTSWTTTTRTSAPHSNGPPDSDPCAGVRALVGTRDLFSALRAARTACVLPRCCSSAVRRGTAIGSRRKSRPGSSRLHRRHRDRARRFLAEARELNSRGREPLLEAWTRFFQGLTETLAGAVEAGREHLEASRALHRELGVRIGEARSTMALGMTFLAADEPARAKELLERCARRHTSPRTTAGAGRVPHLPRHRVGARRPGPRNGALPSAVEFLRPSATRRSYRSRSSRRRASSAGATRRPRSASRRRPMQSEPASAATSRRFTAPAPNAIRAGLEEAVGDDSGTAVGRRIATRGGRRRRARVRTEARRVRPRPVA